MTSRLPTTGTVADRRDVDPTTRAPGSADRHSRRADTAFLDHLRVVLTALVIAHHAAIEFGAEGGWYYRAPARSDLLTPLLTIFCAVNQAFFMGLFFLLAGYFTPGSYERKGAARFLADRCARLGLPLLVYGFVVGPFTLALASSVPNHAGLLATWRDTARIVPFEIGPLWFAWALLLSTLAYAGLRAVSTTRAIERPLPTHRALLLAAVVTGVAAFGLRLWMPLGNGVSGMQIGYFASYVVLFAAGCLGARGRWLQRVDAALARRWILISKVTVPTLFIYGALAGALAGRPFPIRGGWTLPAAAYAMWEPFVAWGIILYLLIRFRSLAPTWRWWPALVRRAYAAYVIHPPILVGLSLAIVPFGLPAAAGFLVTIAGAIGATFLLAGWLLRVPGVARVL